MHELAVLPSMIRHARRLLRDNQDTRACRLLSQALSPSDPVTAPHDPQLIRASMLYVDALSFQHDAPDRADTQLAWARYAQSAALSCYGNASPQWHDTATVYAIVCAAQGLTFDAALMRRRELTAYTQYGPAEHIPHAWETLAAALHADGQCTEAHTEIHDAFSYWRHTGIPAQPVGGQLLSTYAGILAGCGHTQTARALLTDHAHLTAAPGTTDRETAAFITAIHIATTQREHPPVCTIRPARPSSPPPPDSDRWQAWKAILLPPQPPTGLTACPAPSTTTSGSTTPRAS